MMFPLLRFWAYTPLGFVAACIWNVCELLRLRYPYAPYMLGAILNRKPTRID